MSSNHSIHQRKVALAMLDTKSASSVVCKSHLFFLQMRKMRKMRNDVSSRKQPLLPIFESNDARNYEPLWTPVFFQDLERTTFFD
jgi:hypothetical protein